MDSGTLVDWLLDGDPSVAYQTRVHLLGEPPESLRELRARIATEGWGARFLAARDPATAMWGAGLYSPKWISTHYTLLDLMALGMDPATPGIRESVAVLLDGLWPDDGERLARKRPVDTCIVGMLLSISAYGDLGDHPLPGGRRADAVLQQMLDHLLEERLADGGWNCRRWQGEAHSSLHTTVSVAEAMRDWASVPGRHRASDAAEVVPGVAEFLFRHRLYRSESTGEVIDARMATLPFPSRWHYDGLRGLAYLASVGAPWDERMREAVDALVARRDAAGRWPLDKGYSSKTHFSMERVGAPSRWNTLRALRVMRAYGEATRRV
jgi:hypothetical protein